MTDLSPLIESEHHDGRIVIRLGGEIDLSNVESLETQIERAIANAQDVVVDLTAIEFIDSGGLRLLARVSADAARDNRRFAVVAATNSIARSVLDMTGMSAELGVGDSLEDVAGQA